MKGGRFVPAKDELARQVRDAQKNWLRLDKEEAKQKKQIGERLRKLKERKRRMRKKLIIAVLGLLWTGLASAQTCTPVTGSKTPAPHDDGNGIYTKVSINGTNYLADGSLVTLSTTSVYGGEVENYGYANVLGGFGGCQAGNTSAYADSNFILVDYSEACTGSWPQCFNDGTNGNRTVISYTTSAGTGSVDCNLTSVNYCYIDVTDTRSFNVTLVHGHSYRIWAFGNFTVNHAGTTCTYPFGNNSGCAYSGFDPVLTSPNSTYWAFKGIYVQ